ncbi:MAG: polyketide cyclase [Alphaproteobacteria bacterium]|jgi:predicted ester cyclase|nr:polyketide cyclase [Alphaproteobacteria bacterium]
MADTPPDALALTRDNDPTKTEESRSVIAAMVGALNAHVIDGQEAFWHADARWIGNAGCGVKDSLRAFQDGWQRPFLAAFSDKVCVDEARIAEGEWVAAFGRQEATHTGEFMGIPATGRRVTIRYMDFWKVVDGRIAENRVMVDVVDVMRQLGHDPLDGKGWDDRGAGWQPSDREENQEEGS